jgi:ATP-binding cassette subfamily B protein
VLLSGTIASNLKMGKVDATDEEMIDALKDAAAYDFVMLKKAKLNEIVEEDGMNFSGGQRQRLSIARGFLKANELLILDDAYSALDYLTEKEINNNLKKKTEITKIIISQRISSLINADKIIVMYHGKIDSIGTHQELLNKSKLYKEIYESQTRDKK